MLAETSSLTGLSVELSILLTDLITGILFCVGVFCLARQFTNRPEYAVLATLFAIGGSRFVDTTYWDGSARGPLVVLITLTIFVMLRAANTGRVSLYLIALTIGFGCFALHHMAVLFPLYGLGYVMAVFAGYVVLSRLTRRPRTFVALYLSAIGIATVVISYSLFAFLGALVEWNIASSTLFDFEPKLVSTFLNMAASYTNQIGFILPFALVGIVSVLRRMRLSATSLLPVTIMIAFIPLLGNNLYVSMLLSPFVSVLGAMWLSGVVGRTRRKLLVISILTFLIVSSVLLPVWSTDRWNREKQRTGDTVEVGGVLFNDATYMTVELGGTSAIANTDVISLQLAAFTDTDFLRSGIPLVLSNDITPNDVKGNVTFSKATFPINLYTWFEYVNEPNADLYILYLMGLGVSFLSGSGEVNHEARQLFHDHSRLIVAIDNHRGHEFVHVYGSYPAVLPVELENARWDPPGPTTPQSLSSYITYVSERSSLYVLQLPDD